MKIDYNYLGLYLCLFLLKVIVEMKFMENKILKIKNIFKIIIFLVRKIWIYLLFGRNYLLKECYFW